jgi:hypothetical protein
LRHIMPLKIQDERRQGAYHHYILCLAHRKRFSHPQFNFLFGTMGLAWD